MLKNDLVKKLIRIVGKDYVLYKKEDLLTYEYDGSIDKNEPFLVVAPKNEKEVSQILKLCFENNIPVMPRGAGTSLSGGAIPLEKSISLTMSRLNKIIDIDPINKIATVEPGVVNLDLSIEASKYNLYYAPDPSSQKVCTIGGNVAENAGGPHCLSAGVTTNHVLGLEIVSINGKIAWIGGQTNENPGYDLRSIFIGSEGTLGITTKICVKLQDTPKHYYTIAASFNSMDEACDTTTEIIGKGIIPGALEIMDRTTLDAVEPVYNPGYNPETKAVLIVEVEGFKEDIEDQISIIKNICTYNHSTDIRTANDPKSREELWKIRKDAIGAMGVLAPNYYLVDGVVPRTKLKEVMQKIDNISHEFNLTIANVFHAGDGNLHPCILFDERKKGDVQKVIEAGGQILKICVDAGGALSGEHGIGIEKQSYLPWVYSPEDIDMMQKTVDAFTLDTRLLNPGKIFPPKIPFHGSAFGAQNNIVINKTGGNEII